MPAWTAEEVEKVLRGKGWYKDQREIANGVQYKLTDDTPIDVYKSTGRVVVRGREIGRASCRERVYVLV